MNNFFRHLKTVCRHKYWVFYYCCKAGMPVRGLLHDMSKFSPVEFFEGVKYYQGHRSPIDACKEENGYSKGWLHHKARNKHHFDYWIDKNENGEWYPIQMPYKYAVEMVCDYLAAGRTYMGKDFSYAAEYEWWKHNNHKELMHFLTRTFVEYTLDAISKYGIECFNRVELEEFYNVLDDLWERCEQYD